MGGSPGAQTTDLLEAILTEIPRERLEQCKLRNVDELLTAVREMRAFQIEPLVPGASLTPLVTHVKRVIAWAHESAQACGRDASAPTSY